MIKTVGIARDNTDVQSIDIWQDGLSATVLTWGAVLQDLRLVWHNLPLVLGFPKFKHYPRYSPSFGAMVGRYANRINRGQARIDGQTHQLDTNYLGKHCLHGGTVNYGNQCWDIIDHEHNFVTLGLSDPDGMMGFPGECAVTCRYEIKANNILAITVEATTTQTTIFNPAHHSYFSLDDRNDIRGHHLCIAAEHYLPTDAELIPTGEIAAVANTGFDFREMREIGDNAIDHNYCIGEARGTPRPVARLNSPYSGISMDVITTEPGLQLYTGHKLGPPVRGHIKPLYRAFSGVCLEPQIWPDAPNHDHFPSAELTPDERYIQQTEFCFTR